MMLSKFKIVDTYTYPFSPFVDSMGESFLSKSEGTIGLELFIKKDYVKQFLFSQQIIPDGKRTPKVVFPNETGNVACYSLFNYKSPFLPFKMNLDSNVFESILKYVGKHIQEDEYVFIQIILKKLHFEQWRLDFKTQYYDYLNGIEMPSRNKTVRSFQLKILDFLQDKDEFLGRNPPVDRAEDKYEEDGFECCVRFAVYSNNKKKRDLIASKIKLGFSIMNYANSWSITEHWNRKKFLSDVNLRNIPLINSLILCTSEVLPLFTSYEKSNSQEVIVETPTQNKATEKNSPYEIFPRGEKLIREEDGNIEQKINVAFKKLKLVNGARIKIKGTQHGPTVRKIIFSLPSDLKFTQLVKATKDIQAELAYNGISVEQGKEASTVSMVIPQEHREKVYIRDCFENKTFIEFTKASELPFVVGVDSVGDVLFSCLTKIKHLLVVGATGSGKSVFLNVLLVVLLFLRSPKELQMLLIDPKQVELTNYKKFPHVIDVITDYQKAHFSLIKIVEKMEERYSLFTKKGYKNILQYNQNEKERLPYLVVVIDELADLILNIPSVENPIVLLAQKARACGIHLIIATQKPIVDVVTTLIKGNIYSRVCFLCDGSSSYHVAIDKVPDFQLLGHGDGVIRFEGMQDLVRFQGALIGRDDDEQDRIIDHISNHWKINFKKEVIELDDITQIEDLDLSNLKKIILESGETRVTQLQKSLNIRSEKITEMMTGLVSLGWLIKHKSKAKGYELILSDEEIRMHLEQIKKGSAVN